MDRFPAILIIFLTYAFLTGCSGVKSTIQKDKEANTGLLYYMPRQDILLTVKVAPPPATTLRPASDGETSSGGGDSGGKGDKGKKPDTKTSDGTKTPVTTPLPSFSGSSGAYTYTVTVTPPYPDRSQAYWLQYGTNWIAKNTLNVGVSPTGLLQSAKSTTEPGIANALAGLARAAGAGNVLFSDPMTDQGPCEGGKIPGTYVYRIAFPEPSMTATGEKTRCGFTLSFNAITMPEDGVELGQFAEDQTESASGVYYRQAIPYLVQLKQGNDLRAAGILSSPSHSGTYFLPAKSTLFARNEAEFSFSNGMPTLYKQEVDGEVVGALKIPADVIGAYFEAIGEVFGGLAKEPTGKATLIQAQLDLEVARFRQEQCRAAIEAENADAIAAICSAAPASKE